MSRAALRRRSDMSASGGFLSNVRSRTVSIIGQRLMVRSSSADVGNPRSFRTLMACSITASIVMSFALDIDAVAPGLDPSFKYAYNYAAAKGLSWGRQFISTYGPYGYLIHTMDMVDHVGRRIVFDLLLAVVSGIAIAAYLQSIPGLRSAARVGLAIVLIHALNLQTAEYKLLCLFLLVFLMGLHARAHWRSLIAFAMAGCLAGLFLLMKFSLGFSAVMTLIVGGCLARQPLVGVYRLAVAVPAAAVALLIGWTAYGGTLSGIGAYLATGWEISYGYSSAMSLAPHRWWIEVIGILVWFALIIIWVVALRTPRILLTLAGLGFPLFVVWKHSIVRQYGHVMLLMLFGTFVIVLLLAEAGSVRRWTRTLPIAAALLVPLAVPWFNGGPERFYPVDKLKQRLADPLRLQGLHYLARLTRLSGYRADVAQISESALRKSALSDSMRGVIGRASVDVYPWEISYVPANGLSWVNRPLPASFSTYTPALDSLNAAFFESSNRPDYLIWHTDIGVNSIDGRYLLWDEPRTLRTIVNYYDTAMVSPGAVLLRARSQPRFASPQPIVRQTVPWNTWTPVPHTDGVILADAALTRPLGLRMIRMLFREDPVRMSLRFSNGDEATYRLVPDNMGSGLWVSPHPATVDELHSLFQGGPARRVIAVRFSGGLVSRLAPSLIVSWSHVRPLAVPDPAVRSVPIRRVERGDGVCAGHIDGLYRAHDWYGRAAIVAMGWARDGESPILPGNLWLVGGDGRVLATDVQTGLSRPDVAQALGVPGLGGTGWTASARIDGEATDVGFVIRTRGGMLVRSCNRRSAGWGS